ncbi:Spy/CpxP family protein refolding chaperone [Mesoterricola silvestris]|uniref:Periplasmic heavy metal sensor n=1 Tax=Mesoterricola silvestris TaxID=2927979 RepID=A0AA48GXA0_9BACT|nr:Spy/CpxP family protein refolding chaperone [Mesoterricola silvestris]BDU72043.1 hypothetical protein METEAL_12170 [Mesoterricola silvestris]
MIRTTFLTLALAGGLCAQQPPPPCPPGAEGMGRPGPGLPLEALGLTPDQMKACRAVLARRPKAPRAGREAEEALRAAVEDPATTAPQLRALHAAAAEARLQELLDRHAQAVDLDAILTPEQRAKARRIRENLRREQEAGMALREDLEGSAGPGEP